MKYNTVLAFRVWVEQNRNQNFVEEPKFLFSPQDYRKYRHTGYNCRARIFFLCIYSESENKILKLYFLPFWAKKLITNTKVGIPIPLAALVGLLHSAVVKIVVKFTSHSQVSSAYLWCKWHQASAPRLFVDDIFWLCSQCNKIQNLSLDKDVKIVKLQIRGWL